MRSSSGSSPASGRNLAHLVNTRQNLCHDQSLLPLDFVRGGLFMETELGYDYSCCGEVWGRV